MSNKNRFEPNYFYQFRVILIGDSTVGKSSLLRQFTEGQFVQSADPTVGVDFHVRIIELNGDYYISFCIFIIYYISSNVLLCLSNKRCFALYLRLFAL